MVSIILGMLLLTGAIYVVDKFDNNQQKFRYVADSSIKMAYKIDSNNPECNFDSIKIERNNIVYFKNYFEVADLGYNIDKDCD